MNLPAGYLGTRPSYQAYGKLITADAQHVLARAEGLAAGLGSSRLEPEHRLFSLLWARTQLVAVSLLERLGATREHILRELDRGGISLQVRPPAWPSWGQMKRVSQRDFERLAADLRRKGVLYRYSPQNGDVLISVADSTPENTSDPPRS